MVGRLQMRPQWMRMIGLKQRQDMCPERGEMLLKHSATALQVLGPSRYSRVRL